MYVQYEEVARQITSFFDRCSKKSKTMYFDLSNIDFSQSPVIQVGKASYPSDIQKAQNAYRGTYFTVYGKFDQLENKIQILESTLQLTQQIIDFLNNLAAAEREKEQNYLKELATKMNFTSNNKNNPKITNIINKLSQETATITDEEMAILFSIDALGQGYATERIEILNQQLNGADTKLTSLLAGYEQIAHKLFALPTATKYNDAIQDAIQKKFYAKLGDIIRDKVIEYFITNKSTQRAQTIKNITLETFVNILQEVSLKLIYQYNDNLTRIADSADETTIQEEKLQTDIENILDNINLSSSRNTIAFAHSKDIEINDLLNKKIFNSQSSVSSILKNLKKLTHKRLNKDTYLFKRINAKVYTASELMLSITNHMQRFFHQTGDANLGDDFLLANVTLTYNTLPDDIKDYFTAIDAAAKVMQKERKKTGKLNKLKTGVLQPTAKALKELQDKAKSSVNTNNNPVYIIHDTDKFYGRIETGQQTANQIEFHGRSINILNYLATMQEMDLPGNEQLDYELLRLLAINLEQYAAGGGYTSLMENITSHVATIMMFDDFLNNIKLADQKTIPIDSNIHLFSLQQTTYIPASYFLKQQARYLQNLSNGILTTAIIHTEVDIDYGKNAIIHDTINDAMTKFSELSSPQYIELNSALDDFMTYEAVQKSVEQAIKIRIAFAKNYAAFVQDMYNAMF